MASITTGVLNASVLVGCGRFTVVGNVVTDSEANVEEEFELGNSCEKQMKAKLTISPSTSSPITIKGVVLCLYRGFMILGSSFNSSALILTSLILRFCQSPVAQFVSKFESDRQTDTCPY